MLFCMITTPTTQRAFQLKYSSSFLLLSSSISLHLSWSDYQQMPLKQRRHYSSCWETTSVAGNVCIESRLVQQQGSHLHYYTFVDSFLGYEPPRSAKHNAVPAAFVRSTSTRLGCPCRFPFTLSGSWDPWRITIQWFLMIRVMFDSLWRCGTIATRSLLIIVANNSSIIHQCIQGSSASVNGFDPLVPAHTTLADFWYRRYMYCIGRGEVHAKCISRSPPFTGDQSKTQKHIMVMYTCPPIKGFFIMNQLHVWTISVSVPLASSLQEFRSRWTRAREMWNGAANCREYEYIPRGGEDTMD
jgi:hypothetical protein